MSKRKTSRPLKVYGSILIAKYVPEEVNYHHQARHIVAASSFAAACRLLGSRRDFTAETGNSVEIQTAISEPGRVFWQTDRMAKAFSPVPNGACVRCKVDLSAHRSVCDTCKTTERT